MLDPQLSDDTPFENFLRLTEESLKKNPRFAWRMFFTTQLDLGNGGGKPREIMAILPETNIEN